MSERAADCGSALARTLRALGIDETIDREILWFSPPDLIGNGRTYAAVNDDLERLVAAGRLGVTHVTGEARALVDPAHRRVLRGVQERGGQAVLGCHYVSEGRIDARGFLAKQRHHWERAEWFDVVDLLSLVADAAVDVRVMREPASVHFSVFAEDRVLLQDEHHHPTSEKWVWYMRSRPLAERLRPIADRALEGSQPLPPDDCLVLLHWMYSYDVYAVLSGIATQTVVDDVNDVDDVTAVLEELGFVTRTSDSLTLTRLGRQWIDEYETDE